MTTTDRFGEAMRRALEPAPPRRCPVCGGTLRPGVAVHPSCARNLR
jgi:hypothetical protein